ncbi:glycosyltransferase family 4 protein [Phytoactinopolyspora halotolerans]|uniref:Glycosyltransferase family 1 protein n=1 Tax=Phytoactinopolyspora halotolerans TaxID=1981512 RepID=A0A6L9S2E8_9ACTN|nr:glycosyltransferase family 1 protein [Phytoactinopolyspora halotolerans]NED99634.1 glycosyltransferase family 1 protein [Phytoactinopolyspora halotolerans]
MRVAIITESFLPQINGVTNSVCRVVEQLTRRGHDALVVAPGDGITEYLGAPVVRVRSATLPGNQDSVVGLATWRRVRGPLRDFQPDVVHLASPAWLGKAGMRAAASLDIPTVAVFQTDLAGFARGYRLWRLVGDGMIWSWLGRIHEQADRTLAPSSATMQQLAAHGFPRLARWGRGVDLIRFHPSHRDERLRREIAGPGEVIVGYVGRLAPEKRVSALSVLRDLPGVRLAIVGGGPSESALRRELPDAAFLGFRTGEDLSRAYASLDVFVHTGPAETFCQTVQEALASGVPVVGPNSGGPVDLITPGRNGFLADPDDPAQLRAAVQKLATDPELRAGMSTAARRSVQGRSWAAICDELLGHYTAAIARHTAQRASSAPPTGAVGTAAETHDAQELTRPRTVQASHRAQSARVRRTQRA